MPVKLAHLTLGDSTVEDFHRLNHRLTLLLYYRRSVEAGRMQMLPCSQAALEREEQKTVAALSQLMPRVEVRE